MLTHAELREIISLIEMCDENQGPEHGCFALTIGLEDSAGDHQGTVRYDPDGCGSYAFCPDE